MALKSANLYARIEPEDKISAESILAALGIPVSTAISMFYKQIILHNGLPFNVQLPYKKPLSISEMTKNEFDAEIDKGYQSMLKGEGIPANEAFAILKRAK